MLKKIKNYYLFILILIVFILNTILFRSIDITKAQWQPPSGVPGEGTANIVTSPLSADLNLGNYNIIGNGSIGINGTGSFSGGLDVSGDFKLGSIIKSGSWSWAHTSGDSSSKWVKIGSFVLNGAYNNMGITWTIFPTNSNHGDSNERISVQFRNHSTAGPESTYSIEHEIKGGSQYSIKDVKVIRTSGSGLGPYNYSIWVQANASWLSGVPWTAQYEGNVTLNSGSLTQYSSIPDSGTEYDETSIFSNINGNLNISGNTFSTS